MLDSYPRDSKFPEYGKGKQPLLRIYAFETQSPIEFMQGFQTSKNSECTIAQTKFGYWGTFPLDEAIPELCSEILHGQFRDDVVRFTEPFAFRYGLNLFEYAFFIDPGSVVIEP